MNRRTLMLLGMLACIPPWGFALYPVGFVAQLIGGSVQTIGLGLMIYASFMEN